MSEENTFDRISRILASPMPRREAIKLGVGLLGTAVLANLLPSRLLGDSNTKIPTTAALPVPVLKVRVKNFTANKAKVIDVVGNLRNMFGASINFMEHANGPLVDVNVKDGTVQDVLDQIRQQDPTYQVKVIRGRLLVYPNLPILNTVVTPPQVGKVVRIRAAGSFTTYLQKNVKGFEQFGTMFVGSLGSALFQNPVTLSKHGTVLEYLSELAGDDPGAALDIPYQANGWYALNVREVAIWKATTIQKDASPNSSDTLQKHDAAAIASVSAIKPFATSSSGPCRLLSVSYTEGPVVTCDKIPNADPNYYCGYGEIWTVNSVTFCDGDNCVGQPISENVQDQSSDPTILNPNPKPVGTIGKGGTISNVVDYYSACGSAPPPPGGTTRTVSQTINVGGAGGAATAITNIVTITITSCVSTPKPSGTGTVKQTQAPAGTQSQCCGNNPSSSGPDPMTLCSSSQTCVSDNGTANAICCPTGDTVACNHVCCQPGSICITDIPSLIPQCCPSGTPYSCSGVCCPANNTCVGGNCCPQGQGTSDNKTCCPSGQTPYGTICCPTGQNNCNGKCCANTCCGTVCCAAGQTCAGGLCCGQPTPQARMSAAAVSRGSYATDDLALCCAPGHPPCGNTCCPSGSICCNGSCCAGTCDSTGTCVPPPNENT